MSTVKIAFLGDIFGSPGRMVLQQQLPSLKRDHKPDLIIANGENARSGSGLSPQLYQKIRACGVDAVTLGDHVFRDRKIVSVLESPGEPISRPMNLSAKAPGRKFIQIDPTEDCPAAVYVATVLGRIFMNLPADDPFAAVDRLLEQIPASRRIVVIEAHMEATSEKAALARHLDGRVSLVIGTHTHVPTADARILPGGTGFMTDAGMCGPYDSIIGRDPESVLRHLTTSVHTPYSVGSGGEAMCGLVATINPESGRTVDIKAIRYEADHSRPPFSS